MSKTVILMPTYNERQNIKLLVPEIFALHPDICVLVIDDNSPDGTGEAVRMMMKTFPNLSLLSRPQKQGLGEAYKAGMLQVLKDPEVEAVMTMDADGSHAPEYLADLLEAGKQHDLVIGSRYVKGGGIENWETWRYLLSSWGNFYARTITRLPIRDMTAGYMYITTDLLRRMNVGRMRASGYAFLMEIKFAALRVLGGSVKEVPIVFKSRRGGESKISQHIIKEGLKIPWAIQFHRQEIGYKRGEKTQNRIFTKWEPVKIDRHDEIDYDKTHEKKYELLRNLFLNINPTTVLDIGIGTANFYEHLPDYYKYEIKGVDINAEFVKVLNERGIETLEVDISKNPLPYKDESFDFVMCDSILEHTLNPKLLISEIARVLKPEGHFIMVVPNATSIQRRWAHLRDRNIFEPLIDSLYSKDYLYRCSVFYNLRDLRWIVREYLTVDHADFIDETHHDVNALSVKMCRLLSRFKKNFRDVIIVAGTKR